MIKEEFRDIHGFEGYQVSNLGRVKSLSREMLIGGKYPFISKEKILKHSINKENGYNQVILTIYGKRYSKKIHILVASAFLNHFTDGTNKVVIDHISNIKTDNRPENLQIISNRENCSKDVKNGTSKYIGVCWNKNRNKWKAQIDINGMNKHLGHFNTELEAHEAYQNKLSEINSKLN